MTLFLFEGFQTGSKFLRLPQIWDFPVGFPRLFTNETTSMKTTSSYDTENEREYPLPLVEV